MLCVAVLLCVVAGASGVHKVDKYTTRWDHIDLDSILQTERLIEGYAKCLLDEGPCTPDAKDLKSVLPDALATDCSKCSEKQRTGARKVLDHFLEQESARWRQLEEKYDPGALYRTRHKDQLRRPGEPAPEATTLPPPTP